MTAATAAVGYPAAFGVLELLGVCQMVFGALRPRLERARLAYLAAVAAIAFALTAALTARVTVAWRWLYPLGLRYPGFYSSDYYPVFPWAFLFLLGFCLGRRMAARREELPRGAVIAAILRCLAAAEREQDLVAKALAVDIAARLGKALRRALRRAEEKVVHVQHGAAVNAL